MTWTAGIVHEQCRNSLAAAMVGRIIRQYAAASGALYRVGADTGGCAPITVVAVEENRGSSR